MTKVQKYEYFYARKRNNEIRQEMNLLIWERGAIMQGQNTRHIVFCCGNVHNALNSIQYELATLYNEQSYCKYIVSQYEKAIFVYGNKELAEELKVWYKT